MLRTSTLIMLICLVGTISTHAAEVSFVEDGRPANVRMNGGKWNSVNGNLVCSGTGNVLCMGKKFGAGDFTVTADLSINNLRTSAASLVINGSHVGFAGRGGEMFTEGPLFGRHDLGKPVVRNNAPFQVRARRTGDALTVMIDGKTVVTSELDTKTAVDVGLRPWRSTMLVSNFRGSGNLIAASALPLHTTVFRRGAGGYHTYRIPAIVVTKNGTLLAFCEGRKSGGGDAGNIDMLLSRSTDQGKTWAKPQVIWNDADNTCGNPSPVVDQTNGTIWLPMTWNLGSDHEGDILKGKSEQPRQVYVTHSMDDGLTWAKPRKISESARQPHWRWYATGPGNAIQLTRGTNKGRLLIPANHSDHSQENLHPYRSHVIYSDDHGQSWQIGGIHQEKTNESAVVELEDGSVLQAMRSYHGKNRRAMATSQNGGDRFGDVYLDEALDTPVCQASILRYSWSHADGERSRILFSSPLGSSRSNLHVWVSFDEGKSWPIRRQIYSGGAAYSNLLRLPDGRIGVLYEKDEYSTISLATFDLKWLETE